MILEILKTLFYSFIAFCAVLLAGCYLLFPEQMKWIWNLVNLAWARTSARDIGVAAGKMVPVPMIGAVIEGVLLGLIGVWILLKTGSLEKIREFGGSIGGGVPRMVSRIVVIMFLPIVVVGSVAISIAKLDPMWAFNAVKGVWMFAVLDVDFNVGVIR